MNFITLSVAVLVSGSDMKQAAKIFTRVVIDDIRLCHSQNSQHILGKKILNIPKVQSILCG